MVRFFTLVRAHFCNYIFSLKISTISNHFSPCLLYSILVYYILILFLFLEHSKLVSHGIYTCSSLGLVYLSSTLIFM